MHHQDSELERKFMSTDQKMSITSDGTISGYASLFNISDQSGDIVKPGAFETSLKERLSKNVSIKMLWQHDPSKPIGVWHEVFEDEKGLFVSGKLIKELPLGAQVLILLEAGAIDGLSIGFRTSKSSKGASGERFLTQVELWEVSLVTFPMQIDARVKLSESKSNDLELKGLLDQIKDLNQTLKSNNPLQWRRND